MRIVNPTPFKPEMELTEVRAGTTPAPVADGKDEPPADPRRQYPAA